MPWVFAGIIPMKHHNWNWISIFSCHCLTVVLLLERKGLPKTFAPFLHCHFKLAFLSAFYVFWSHSKQFAHRILPMFVKKKDWTRQIRENYCENAIYSSCFLLLQCLSDLKIWSRSSKQHLFLTPMPILPQDKVQILKTTVVSYFSNARLASKRSRPSKQVWMSWAQ